MRGTGRRCHSCHIIPRGREGDHPHPFPPRSGLPTLKGSPKIRRYLVIGGCLHRNFLGHNARSSLSRVTAGSASDVPMITHLKDLASAKKKKSFRSLKLLPTPSARPLNSATAVMDRSIKSWLNLWDEVEGMKEKVAGPRRKRSIRGETGVRPGPVQTAIQRQVS